MRCYSFLTIKSVDEEKRVLTGVATTPTPDRLGDIVEPLGVRFKNPLPLLWQHNSSEPVGTVKFDKPTEEGINFTAKLPSVLEPGRLKERIDEAWQSVKLGLVRAVSIGFRPLEYSFMDDGGIRFAETEVLELSLVTIPAQADARIETIKAFDVVALAASGQKVSDDRPKPPSVVERKPVKAQERTMKKTITEQIAAFVQTKQSKSEEMDKIMDDAADKGETLDAEHKEKWDTLKREVDEIDEHLVRLRAREKSMQMAAVPVSGGSAEDAAVSRGGNIVQFQPITVRRNVPPGIMFVRTLAARYAGFKHHVNPADWAKSHFPDTPEVELVLRAAVAPGTTTNPTFAAPLALPQIMASEFVELLRAATIIDRLGLRRVPFNVTIPRQTSDPTAAWVGEAGVKPVSAGAFDSLTLLFNKVAGIVPMTEELMRFSTPSAEMLVRDALIAAITFLVDRDFLDPTKAEVVGVSPASVTNGVTPIVPSGTTADAMRDDLARLLGAYASANMGLAGLKLVMTSTQAIKFALMRNALGQKEFPDMSVSGGVMEGLPVITSENVVATGGSPADGFPIVAINTPMVALADDGGVEIDISREASLQMDTAPDSPTTASTVLVSLWQRNMVAIKAERFITWKKLRTGCVQYISNGKYI